MTSNADRYSAVAIFLHWAIAALILFNLGLGWFMEGFPPPIKGAVVALHVSEMEERQPRPLILICGMLTTKDPIAFLEPFAGLAQELIAVPIGSDHAGRSADDLAAAATRAGLRSAACASVKTALNYLAGRDWLQGLRPNSKSSRPMTQYPSRIPYPGERMMHATRAVM